LQVNAYVYLTEKRFILIPSKLIGYGLTGVLTATTYNKMTSNKGVISIPLEQIKSVDNARLGLLGKDLVVTTPNDITNALKVGYTSLLYIISNFT
jgi:hypothetical protein